VCEREREKERERDRERENKRVSAFVIVRVKECVCERRDSEGTCIVINSRDSRLL